MCLTNAAFLANNVDPDQMPHSMASDLGLHCFPRPFCLNTQGTYPLLLFPDPEDATVLIESVLPNLPLRELAEFSESVLP